MSSAIEVLKKDVASYESLKADNKIIKTLNNEEVCMMHYPQVKEAIVALEQKERIKEWLNENIRLNKQIQPLVKSHDGELLYEVKIGIMEKVLELMK